jgi:hypothetical protein
MHVVVTQAVLREGIQVGSLAEAAEAADLAEAHVIENDEQDIGRSFFSPQRLRPRGTGDIERSPDHAGKCGSRFVFFKCHFHFLQLVLVCFFQNRSLLAPLSF